MQWKVPGKYKFPEFFLLVPQAAYWVAGSQSATTWQVTDIKELKDPEVVLEMVWFIFMTLLSDILVTTQARKSVCVCFVSVFGAVSLMVGGGINW